MVNHLVEKNLITPDRATDVEAALLARENHVSTAIGNTVSVPHVYLVGIKQQVVFFVRLSLWLRDPALYPVTHYIRRVPHNTIHLFTMLQTVCLAVLWFVKSSALGILFPFFIVLFVPVRLLANRFFAAEHLAALDAEEDPGDEETHWPG